jgi:hypothetical protein
VGQLRQGVAVERRALGAARRGYPEAQRRAREATLALRRLPSTQLLERNLARMVMRVGIETARLVLNPTPLRIALAAVRAFQLAQEMTRDEGRGR